MASKKTVDSKKPVESKKKAEVKKKIDVQKLVDGRIHFASVQNPMPYPDFLDVQLKSFKDFLQLDTPPEKRKNDGLYKVFAENFPITDTRNSFVLEFLDYFIDPPRYTVEECLERGLTYSVPLKARMKLYCTDQDHEDFGTHIQDVFLGTIPYIYKTTGVSIALALIIIEYPNDRTMFMRKTDNDVKEVIKQVKKILELPVTNEFVKALYAIKTT